MEEAAMPKAVRFATIASRQANWNGVLVQQCHLKTFKKFTQKLNFLEFGEQYTLGDG